MMADFNVNPPFWGRAGSYVIIINHISASPLGGVLLSSNFWI